MAKQLAELNILKNESCPITLEKLATYDKLYVGTCGHVFSPDVKEQTKCPTCRCETEWTLVNFPK